MSVLPTNDTERKNLPLFKMITGYFPKALREVTRVCVANNVRYNPDRKPSDINWARGKSADQMGSLFRHVFEAAVDGTVYEHLPPEVQAACGEGFDRVYILAEAAWRALAALELQIEEQECKKPFEPLTLKPCAHCDCAPCKCMFFDGVRIIPDPDHQYTPVPAGTVCSCSSFARQAGDCLCGPLTKAVAVPAGTKRCVGCGEEWLQCSCRAAAEVAAAARVAQPHGYRLCFGLAPDAKAPITGCNCGSCEAERAEAATGI